MYFKLPEYVGFIIEALEKEGFEAYAVGGCVRDLLLGTVPSDYDITTAATPDQIKRIFEKTVDTGIKHGTVTVISDGEPVEVTTFRTESDYSDMRHPESVSFVSDIREDLKRRDFTVNAMAYNEKRGLIDFFGGKEDLKNKILRAVGEPCERFSEDALRILRLFRFASVLDFTAEENTLKAALSLAGNLTGVSAERISAELKKAANGKNVAALSPLIRTGALDFLFISYYDRLSGIEALPKGDLRLFAFLYLCSTSPIETAEVLKFSNRDRQYIIQMTELMAFELSENSLDVKYALRDSGEVFGDYLTFLRFITGKNTDNLNAIYRKIIKNGEPYRICDLAVNGDDLIKLGFSGKKIGFLLEFLLDKVIEEPLLNTKEKLLRILKN